MDWDAALAAFATYLEVERATRRARSRSTCATSPRCASTCAREARQGRAAREAVGDRGPQSARRAVRRQRRRRRSAASCRACARSAGSSSSAACSPATRPPRSAARRSRRACRARSMSTTRSGWSRRRPTTGRTIAPHAVGRRGGAPRAAAAARSRRCSSCSTATGLRVSEACALDITDIDRDRYGAPIVLVRRGKGGKSREVPLGGAADRALDAYLAGAPRARRRRRPALFVNAQRRAPDAALGAAHGQALDDRRRRPRGRDAARRCATRSRPTCSTRASTCARSRSCSATRACRRRRSTPRSRSTT